jgi:hypothetical protein
MSKLLYQFEKTTAGGVVNTDAATISGVSMITGNVTAKGHDLEVDETTLKQLLLCAQEKGKVPVKTNHGSGVDAVNGYLDNFRLQNGKLLGDWHLLKSYPQTAQLLEMAERMPESVGLSVAFHGTPETKDGRKVLAELDDKGAVAYYYTVGAGGKKEPLKTGEKKHARCSELVSTDLVASPAANPDGMFSERGVDSQSEGMAKPSNSTSAAQGAESAAEPTLADLMKAIQGLSGRIEAIETGGHDDDEDGHDVQLTEEDVKQGLEEGWLEQGKDGELQMVGQPADGDDGDAHGDQGGESANVDHENNEAAAQAALARGDAATYFQIRYEQSEARIAALESRFAAQDTARRLATEQQVMTTLEAKQTELITALSATQAQLQAKDELIRELQVQAPRVRSSGDGTLFNAQTSNGEVTFESEVAKVNQALMTSAPTMNEFDRKATALNTVQKASPHLYAEHLKRKGVRA